MPTKTIRFTDAQIKAIDIYCKQTDKIFSDAARDLIDRGLHEHQLLQSLGVSNLNDMAKKLPIHEKKRLNIEVKTYLMLQRIMYKVAKEETPEKVDTIINEQASTYLQDEFFG